MLLTFHIAIALTSLVASAGTYFLPSKTKIRISQTLIALTLASGSYLVFSLKANLLRVCAMGLIYTAIVVYAITAAQRKLAVEVRPSDN